MKLFEKPFFGYERVLSKEDVKKKSKKRKRALGKDGVVAQSHKDFVMCLLRLK